MSIEEIRSRISVINAETSRVNNQRNQNIGRQETLKKQLSDAFALYEKNYGVKLTVETLPKELESVTAKKEDELGKIESILSCIKAGNIEEANKLAGVTTEAPSSEVTEKTAETSEPAIPTGMPTDSSVTPITTQFNPSQENNASSIGASTVTPPVSEPPKVAEPPKIAEPPHIAEPPKVAPPTSPLGTLSGVETLSGAQSTEMPALDGFTKPSLGSLPTQQDASDSVASPSQPVSDFNAILNGSAFGK